jgi:hypothetical protein
MLGNSRQGNAIEALDHLPFKEEDRTTKLSSTTILNLAYKHSRTGYAGSLQGLSFSSEDIITDELRFVKHQFTL